MTSRLSGVDAPIRPDPLSEVLRALHLGEVSSRYGQLSHPWGISFSAQAAARFHFVVTGTCWMATSGGDWIALESGDAVLLPHGAEHVLSSSRNGVTQPCEQVQREYVGGNTYRIRAGGTGASALLFCCRVSFPDPGLQPLLELMPPVLLLRSAARRDPVLPVLLDTMAAEVLGERIGSATVLSRLAEVVVARVLRAWAEEHQADTGGWLAAIQDPRIGRAVAAIHGQPGHDWSVEALAAVACVSRSVFTERFTQLIGVTPGRYLTRLRMHLACNWLRTDQATVAQVSERVGYESEAAFSRAFKRHVGASPSEVRRSARI